MYTNINSYSAKRYLINNTIDKLKISCALFVETKTRPQSNTTYKNWQILRRDGVVLNQNIRGGSLVQVHPTFRMQKMNSPSINNPWNEALHFAIPFKEDKLHIFVVYMHPNSSIEENVFTMASSKKYAMIIGDFNINNQTKRKHLKALLRNRNFSVASTPPTFVMPNNMDSTPDLVIYSNNMENCIGIQYRLYSRPGLGSSVNFTFC